MFVALCLHLNPEKAHSSPCSTHCSTWAPRVDELNSSLRQFKACTRERQDLLLLLASSAAANNAFNVRVSNGLFPLDGSACSTAATAKVTADDRRTVGASPERARAIGIVSQREGRSNRLELELRDGVECIRRGRGISNYKYCRNGGCVGGAICDYTPVQAHTAQVGKCCCCAVDGSVVKCGMRHSEQRIAE
jgi:hypothetical protein